MVNNDDQERVPTTPPQRFASDEEAREFGRQLAMDALLERALQTAAADSSTVAFPAWRRIPVMITAAAAVLILGAVLLPLVKNDPDGPGPIALATDWQVQPVGAALFSILAPNRVRLEQGELLVFSEETRTDPNPLIIETANAEATATGTRFYVGTHTLTNTNNPQTTNTTDSTNTPLTRVLVLAGTVTMTTSGGAATATTNELIAAKGNEPPTNLAVQANSDFAVALYRQLSQEDGNLFFSPFSVSSALAMAAEGARGETALEMGKVLRFPELARRTGDNAQRIPWETAKIHSGMADLNTLLNGTTDDTPEIKAVRAKIAGLRDGLAKLRPQIRKAEGDSDWKEVRKLARSEGAVVAGLNRMLAMVDQYELRVANALWAEKTYPFRAEYAETIAEAYGTGAAFPANFRGDPDAERLRINKWVAERTGDRIGNILSEGSITPETALVITNAVYFRGNWTKPFDKGSTQDLDFFTAPGRSIKTPIMYAALKVGRYGAFEKDGSWFKTPVQYEQGTDPQLYPDTGGFALYELPYKGDNLSMVVLTPTNVDGLAAIEKELTTSKLTTWIGQLKHRRTKVYLPKFKAETSYKMKDTLTAMGMTSAFIRPSQGGADFSGMTTSDDPNLQLYIDQVLHKASITVGEEGTEAAAATAVNIAVDSAPPVRRMVNFTPTFRADRPFLFLIRDKRSGSILFLGRITQPEA